MGKAERLKDKETEIIKSVKSFKNISEAKDFAKENFQGKSFRNKDTGEDILVSRNSIDKTLSSKAFNQSENQNAHIKTMGILDKIIENSILVEEHSDKNNSQDVEGVQRFYGAVEIDGDVYRVKTTVKQIKNEGNKYYTILMKYRKLNYQRKTTGNSTLWKDQKPPPIVLIIQFQWQIY